jgi:hypothetical protein
VFFLILRVYKDRDDGIGLMGLMGFDWIRLDGMGLDGIGPTALRPLIQLTDNIVSSIVFQTCCCAMDWTMADLWALLLPAWRDHGQ